MTEYWFLTFIKNNKNTLLQDGERWMYDDCTVCVCDGGKSVCYSKHCPVCTDGMKSIALPGECCGTCKSGIPSVYLQSNHSL